MVMGFASILRWSHKRADSPAPAGLSSAIRGFIRHFCVASLTDPEQSGEFRNFVSYRDRSMCLFDIGASYGAFSFVAAHFGGLEAPQSPLILRPSLPGS